MFLTVSFFHTFSACSHPCIFPRTCLCLSSLFYIFAVVEYCTHPRTFPALVITRYFYFYSGFPIGCWAIKTPGHSMLHYLGIIKTAATGECSSNLRCICTQVAPACSKNGSSHENGVCICGVKACSATTGLACPTENVCDHPTCGQEEGTFLNTIKCRCGSATMCSSSSGMYCFASLNMCSEFPICDYPNGTVANTASCTCGTAKCVASSSGSFCTTSMNRCRPYGQCDNFNGSSFNRDPCTCGAADCTAENGLVCTSSSDLCHNNTLSACPNVIGSKPNDQGCFCANSVACAAGDYCLTGSKHMCSWFPACRSRPENVNACVRCDPNDDLKCAQCSGDSYAVDGICREPQRVVASEGAFAYIGVNRNLGTNRGHVLVWGHFGPKQSRSGLIEESGQFYPSESAEGFKYSQPHSGLAEDTKNVASLYSTDRAFAALRTDGSVTAWGYPLWGGKIPDFIQEELDKEGVFVRAVYSNRRAFAVLCTNGQVFTWGSGSTERGDDYGGRVKELRKRSSFHIFQIIFIFLLTCTHVNLCILSFFYFFSLCHLFLQNQIFKHNLLILFLWCQTHLHFLR